MGTITGWPDTANTHDRGANQTNAICTFMQVYGQLVLILVLGSGISIYITTYQDLCNIQIPCNTAINS